MCLLLILTLVFTALPLTVHAATETIAEGYDRNIYWHVDSVPEFDGDWRLTVEPRVEGTSVPMPDYSLNKDYYSTAPWADDRNLNYKNLKEIVIADGITYIGAFSFVPKGNGSVYSYLKHAYHYTLTMADSVTAIAEGAFSKMGLDSIRWSENLKTIGKNAFYLNEFLPSIELPDSVQEIGESAFWLCRNATSLSFGQNLTVIPDDAFERCESLTDVYYRGTPEKYNEITVGVHNDEFSSAKVHVPMSGSVTTSVTNGVAVGKMLTATRMGSASTLNAVNYRWERSADKTTWETVGKSDFYTIQKEDSEQYLRVCIYNGTTKVGGRTFYVDGTLYSSPLKMPEFPICEIRAVLNISKDVDVKIWRRVYLNGERLHRYDGTIADSVDKKYTWIPGLYRRNYTLEFSPASTYVPRTYEIEVKGEEWLDVVLNKYGDINGDGAVKNGDYSRILAHLKGTKTLEGYEFACADINGDGEIKNGDLSRVLAHLKGTKALW